MPASRRWRGNFKNLAKSLTVKLREIIKLGYLLTLGPSALNPQYRSQKCDMAPFNNSSKKAEESRPSGSVAALAGDQ